MKDLEVCVLTGIYSSDIIAPYKSLIGTRFGVKRAVKLANELLADGDSLSNIIIDVFIDEIKDRSIDMNEYNNQNKL